MDIYTNELLDVAVQLAETDGRLGEPLEVPYHYADLALDLVLRAERELAHSDITVTPIELAYHAARLIGCPTTDLHSIADNIDRAFERAVATMEAANRVLVRRPALPFDGSRALNDPRASGPGTAGQPAPDRYASPPPTADAKPCSSGP